MRLRNRGIFFEAAEEGICVRGNSFYTHRTGTEKVRYRTTSTQSDKADTLERSFSEDNGRTWSEPEHISFIRQESEGVFRRTICPSFVDPETDRIVGMAIHAWLPTDNPLEGLKTRYLAYRVSTDGGKTYTADEQVIQKGGYTPEHPLDGVWVGKNGVNIGDLTCRPIHTQAGDLLFPIQIAPLGPDGEYYNPGGGYTYGEAAVLIGRWIGIDEIEWDLSQRVRNDPNRSTRGCIEPTIAEMPGGRILMVVRGSNDVKPDLPGYKWYSVSEDGGYTWSPVQPWKYDTGEHFFSPSSCSQLLYHSNGRYYWLGNITPGNPKGNRPRYPYVIGEVDPEHLMLIKSSVVVIDDKQRDDGPSLTLSNFMAHEDRESRDSIVHMSRPFSHGPRDRTTPAYVYRIEP